MEKKKLEIKDAVIPPVVENRISQTLAQIQSEEKNTMHVKKNKRYIKRAIAIAACATICLTGGYAVNRLGNSNPVTDAGAGKLADIADKMADRFIIKVNAAELTGQEPVPIHVNPAESADAVLDASDDNRDVVSYCFNLPLTVEGENIEKVTYTINEGCFQVIESSKNPYVTDGVECDALDLGRCGGFNHEAGMESEEAATERIRCMTSVTLDYSKQAGDDFWLNFGNVKSGMQEAFDLIWGEGATEESCAKAYNLLMGDTVIEVTVTYTDGTTNTKKIQLEGGTMDSDGSPIAEIYVKEMD